MPYGKGTYGSKIGRPKKRKRKKSSNGSTTRRKVKRAKRV